MFKKITNFINKHMLEAVFLFFLFFSLYLIFNLYNLQIIKGEYYNDIVISKAEQSYVNKVKRRGTIFFKNNDSDLVAVAIQEYIYSLVIDPSKIKNANSVFEKINKVRKIDREEFIKKANKNKSRYEKIIARISENDVKKLKKEKLPGVYYIKQSIRKYPFSETASKIIGFVNFDMIGTYGLEKYYEEILSRKKENQKSNIFKLFFNSENDKIFKKKVISKEGDLISNIDIGLSSFLEKILKEVDEKYKSKYTAAIILRPASGEVIAMSDSKSFDLNIDRKDYRNVFVEYRFEVGSTFKPLVATIGLESGKITRDFSYNDKGCVKVKQKTICNFDRKGRGPNTSLQKVISQSLNTGMIEIERRIGHKSFLRYLLDLGLSEETGVDLPGEISSNLSNLNDINDINYAAASFGQGIAFTPIAITRALSALANDGYMITPHLVEKIDYGGLIPNKDFSAEKKKVFSPYSIKTIKDILIKRADDYAKNKDYFNENYSVASKTGTAQIASAEGGYEEGKNIHTYFGFFPANAKPEDRYAIFIYTIEPQNVKYSSQTLTEPFYKLFNFMISYFDINPDRAKIEF